MIIGPIQKPRRGQVARARQMPPPVGGINARDALDLMPQEDAIELDNWFPRTNDVELRHGYTLHSDQLGSGVVQTLAEYHSGTTRKLIAACDGKVQDATLATPSVLGSGFSSDRWQTAMFQRRLILCNGADAPQDFDGTTLSATAWSGTGLTISDLVCPLSFKNRLLFVEKDTQSFWYGGLGAVTGALNEFDLSQVGNFGGNLVAMGAITKDGGDGVDDLLACLMSSGEVLIYQGTDPGTDFQLAGVFYIGAPVGQRPLARVGSDLVVITRDGYVPLTQVLSLGRVRDDATLSDKISGMVGEAVRDFGGNDGWEVTLYPERAMLIFNVPTGGDVFHQHVMNTRTRAWGRFKGMNGYTFALFNDALYFGAADGCIYKAYDGTSDNGDPIIARGRTSFSYFGDRGRIKRWTAARPILQATGQLTYSLALATDFADDVSASTVTAPDSGLVQPIWDQAVWDDDIWGGGFAAFRSWQSVRGIGYAASLGLSVETAAHSVRWHSTSYTYEHGGLT